MHFKVGKYIIFLFSRKKKNYENIFRIEIGKYIVFLLGKQKKEKIYEDIGKIGKNSQIIQPSIYSEIEKLFIGNNTTILSNSRIQSYSDKGLLANKIIIKDSCYIGFYFSCLNGSTIEIGNNVLIASNVLITSIKHGINPELDIPYMDQKIESSPVIVGDNCWIGEKAIILPGVTIGEGCIIGAGSIVTKDIPPFSIAVGNPAKVIKKYNFSSHYWELVK